MSTAMVKEEARPDDDDVVPISIISDILSRLPVDDVARCKAVGKSWYELSKDPYFTRLHFTTSSQHTTTNSVLLWKADDYASLGISYNMISNKNGEWKSFTLSPQANVRGIVQASCNGLLCLNNSLIDEEGPNLVYNPLTREAIPLPQPNLHPDDDKGHGYKSAFGFDPITNKYKLVSAYKSNMDDTSRMTAAILTLGETSWRTLQFPHDLQTAILYHEPLFFNGEFHWVIGKRFDFEEMTLSDGILTLDITNENFQIINFSPSLRMPYSCLAPLQLENSLAFAIRKHNNHLLGSFSFEIWQIQGANTDGTCLYKHHTINVKIEGYPLIDRERFTLLGAFNNGVFLFKEYRTFTINHSLQNHLVLYDAQKDQGSVIEISGVPKYFSAHIFSPSFISPTL